MFVAIDLDDRARAAVRHEQALAARAFTSSSIRFMNPRQAHLTLAFLADVPAPLSDRIVDAMQQPIDGIGAFHLAFGGLGIFPAHGAPRVLWLAVSEGAAETMAVQAVVARRLEALGAVLEDRAFHPHLTIGRWRRSRPSDRPALPAEPRSAGGMTVDRVTLYESRLSSEGPTHIERAHAVLT